MKIALVGGSGKLGKATQNVLQAKHQVVNIDIISGNFTSLLQMPFSVDMIVDVSNAKQSIESLHFAQEKNLPIVIACTGHDDEQRKEIAIASEHIAVFVAYNMAYGVQVFKDAATFIAERFGSEIHLHETHHTAKVDRPSGTAKEVKTIFEKHGKAIEISSARGGNVVGMHDLCFFDGNEIIELKHTALSREVFANGIEKAVEFLINQKCGLFGMQDLSKSTKLNK